jgi:hypothetical protein
MNICPRGTRNCDACYFESTLGASAPTALALDGAGCVPDRWADCALKYLPREPQRGEVNPANSSGVPREPQPGEVNPAVANFAGAPNELRDEDVVKAQPSCQTAEKLTCFQAWICPKCGAVWAWYVRGCERCNDVKDEGVKSRMKDLKVPFGDEG